MDIQQLRYFNAIVHLENISKAADSLHISQSALSKQIRALENELGVSLFDRHGKRITLNKAGMRFYRSSEQILRELQSAGDDIRMLVSRETTRIRIGSTSMPSEMLRCIGEFSRRYPEVSFVLNTRVDYNDSVDMNQYDALICPEEFRFEHLTGYHLCDETFFFAAPARSPAASEAVFSFDTARGLPFVFLQGEDLSPEYPYTICSSSGLETGPLFFTDTRDSHRRMIAEGMACGFVPATEASGYRNDPDVRLLPVLDPRFTRHLKICFLRERHLSHLGLLFRDHVMRFFELKQERSPS